jgi:phospholipid/cholesterol/gamma-HCH transport system substrate-binding protein
MVCHRGRVAGVAAASLDTVTETVQKLLDDAERQQLVPQMVAATKSFEQSARETEKLSRQGQVFIKDTRGLVNNVNRAVGKADPIITNLNAASADAARATREAAKASKDVRRITASLSTSGSVADLQATLANARKLTDRWQAVGGDVNKLTGDPKFLDGIRSVAVGLGSFFEELYPAQVDAARQRDARQQGSAASPASADPPPSAPPDARAPRRPPLPPPPRKQRVLSAADQREADRERAAAGIRSR